MENSKTKTSNIILAVISVLILLGVGATTYILVHSQRVIDISVAEDSEQTICMEDISLVPGSSIEYFLRFSSEITADYEISLRFAETNSLQTLKDYAFVRLEYGKEVLCDEKLSTLFDWDPITLHMNLSKHGHKSIRMTCYLPETVGNDAQGAEAEFELIVTTERTLN